MRLARSSEAGERKEEAELFTQNATPSFLLYFRARKICLRLLKRPLMLRHKFIRIYIYFQYVKHISLSISPPPPPPFRSTFSFHFHYDTKVVVVLSPKEERKHDFQKINSLSASSYYCVIYVSTISCARFR